MVSPDPRRANYCERSWDSAKTSVKVRIKRHLTDCVNTGGLAALQRRERALRDIAVLLPTEAAELYALRTVAIPTARKRSR